MRRQHNCGMDTEPPMPPIPKLPSRPDLLKHFTRHCAAVKLLALGLIVIGDWGRTALYVGIPSGLAWLVARHVV
jgi:hypothetical protein